MNSTSCWRRGLAGWRLTPRRKPSLGIGRANLEPNLRTKSEVEIDLMRKVKAALDPENLMNPGKVVPG